MFSLPLQHVLPAASPFRSARSRLLRVRRLRSFVCACVERLRRHTQRNERWESRREHEQPPHSALAPAARPTTRINNKTDKTHITEQKKSCVCVCELVMFVESKQEYDNRETKEAKLRERKFLYLQQMMKKMKMKSPPVRVQK